MCQNILQQLMTTASTTKDNNWHGDYYCAQPSRVDAIICGDCQSLEHVVGTANAVYEIQGPTKRQF